MRYVTPILSLVAVLLAIAAITYAIASALPGDAAEVRVGKRDDLTFAERDALVQAERKRLGLDKPVPIQFVIWLEKAFQGDLGTQEGGGPVGPAVVDRIVPSLELAILTLLVSLPTAALLAVRSVRRGKRVFSTVTGQLSTVGFVIPQFWLGILLVILFAVKLGWLPAGGYYSFGDTPVEHLKRLIMPLITLAIPTTAVFFHFMRQSLRESLSTQ
jgi:peptide/nickel transport system permease protein